MKHETAAKRAMRLAKTDALATAMGIECVAAGAGQATVSLTVAPHHLNFMNTCHGGVIFTLADVAFSLASNSHGEVAMAIDAHVTYQVAALTGDTLTAVCQEISRTSKLAVYRAVVTRQDGTVVSAFTGTAYVTSRRHTDPGA